MRAHKSLFEVNMEGDTSHPRKGGKRLRLALALASMGAILLAGCAGSPSMLLPYSTSAQKISNLIILTFSIAAAVFVIVEGMLIYASIHYSRRSLKGEPSKTEGNQPLEIGWTLLPATVLLVVFILTIPTLRAVAYQPQTYVNPFTGQSGKPMEVHVVGHQWWWEFDYPEYGIVTANEMHVPVGVAVNVSLASVDVIHSFWVPQLFGKTDVIPGHNNTTWFLATKTGEYYGQCAEFCGAEHALMRLRIIVDTPEQFQAWVKQMQAPVQQMTGLAAQGEQAFMNGPCIGCHTIDNTNAQGKVGPNLTHFASRQYFAGDSFENTPENVAQWLKDPQAMKPGSLMPNLHLSQDEINQLVAFLDSLK
jgi:cytochrome c oxidase subunit 2